MSELALTELELNTIYEQVIVKNKLVTIQQCEAVWQCFVKTIASYADPKKIILVFDMFYVCTKSIHNFNMYSWSPTSMLLEKCNLKYQNDIPSLQMTIVLTKQKMSRNLVKEECLKPLGDAEEAGWQLLEEIFKQIKYYLTNLDNFEIDLEFFGILRVQSRLLQHFAKEDKNIRIKTLMTPKKKTSNLRLSRRESQLISLSKMSSSQNLSQDEQSMISQKERRSLKKSSLLNPLTTKSVGNLNAPKIHQLDLGKTRAFNYNFASPDAKISNDLLGAGIDPLKFDYNYSKLVNQSEKLFNKTFSRPKPAKLRHPGIIDKFERTTGVPQTGTKVSNSVVVRIGSNYNPPTKHLYCDIKSKCIEFVPREPKIALNSGTKIQVAQRLCATEKQEYLYVTKGKVELHDKVENRIYDFGMYTKYIQQYIDNSNVCPLPKEAIKRIINQVRSTFKGDMKDPVSVEIMDKSINEANQLYYFAYKKSILDYILKDEKERERTGICTIFNPPVDWGTRKIKGQAPVYRYRADPLKVQKAQSLLESHLHYPKCILELSELNVVTKQLDLFRIQTQDSKPVNVLYFIKRQNTHIADTVAYLATDWVKGAAEIAYKYVDMENEEEQKLNTFFKLINVMLSNCLKNIIYTSFKKLLKFFKRFQKDAQCYQMPILQLSIIDEGNEFIYSDNLEKIMIEEIQNLSKNIITQCKKIHGIEFYLKDDSNSFLWANMQESAEGENTNFYEDVINEIIDVIRSNNMELEEYLTEFQKYSTILKFQEQTSEWLRSPRTIEEIEQKSAQIEKFQQEIEEIPYSHSTRMVQVELFDEREKLRMYLDNIKGPLFQNLCNSVTKGEAKCLKEIEEIKNKISAPIENSDDYLKVSTDLQQIKKKRLSAVQNEMQITNKCLLKLHTMDYGFVYTDIIYKVYKTNQALRNLNSKIEYHEERLAREKMQLESSLREKVKAFEVLTISQLAAISARINEFQLRRVYNDYLVEVNSFKKLVEENDLTIADLTKQQENLKLNKNNFKAAQQLKNIVLPNHELWNLVLEYDSLMKQWKNKQICHMDVNQVKKRVEDINFRVSRNIKKLKNLSSLKVAYELQKDAKDILTQHIHIIEIFSHPGLKERHWQLFNSKLMIPGIDLKEIPYSKIKIFEEYEKNLKVLSVISSQAAKEFQIENQKNDQQEYWSSINFETYSNKIENSFSISQTFLANCLATLEEHSSKLSVMKNYLYSKALYQQLQDWESWLSTCRKNLQNFKTIQEELKILRPIFSYDQIGKQLPVEVSEFESIDNSWKNLMKKVWEHTKLAEFMKNPKITEMIEEICKKIDVVKRGIQLFLSTIRSEFPRFYFVKQSDLIQILVKSAYIVTEKEGISKAFSLCFAPGLELVQNDEKFLSMVSQTDTLTLDSDIHEVKNKKKICENMFLLEKCMRESIRSEILQLSHVNLFHDINKYTQKYCLTSIFCFLNIQYSQQIEVAVRQGSSANLIEQKNDKIKKLAETIKQQEGKLKDEDQKQKLKCKKIIKLSKMILSLIGEIEKIRFYQEHPHLREDSFEYLTELKFQIKSSDEIKDEKIQKSVQKIESSMIKRQPSTSKVRRSSIKQGSIVKNFRIEVSTFGRTLEFQEQFYGDETHNYLPYFTKKTAFNLVNSIVQGFSTSLCRPEAKILLRKLAIMCGKSCAQLTDTYFNNEEGFQSLLFGVVSSNTWVCIDCTAFKINLKNWQKMNSLLAELRMIRNGSQEIKFGSSDSRNVSSLFLKSLNQVTNATFDSGCFFYFNGFEKLREIPLSVRTQMRNVSLVVPHFSDFVKSQSVSTLANLSKKYQSQCIRNGIFEITFLYQKDHKVKKLTKFLLKIMEYKENEIEQKEKLQSLIELILNQYMDKSVYQFLHPLLSLYSQQQSSQMPRKLSKQSHYHHPSIMKQKINLEQYCRKSKQTFSQNISNNNKVIILYGSMDIKTSIVTDTIKQMPGYSKIERSLYSYPLFAFKNSEILSFMRAIVKGLVVELRKVFFNKAFSKEIREGDKEIYLHIEHGTRIDDQTLKLLGQCVAKLEQEGIHLPESQQTQRVRITLIVETVWLSNLSPSTVSNVCKQSVQTPEYLNLAEFYSNWLYNNIKIDKQRSYDSRVQYDIVMHNLVTMQPILDNVLNMCLKALSAKTNKTVAHQKYMLMLRFLRMFKIYIDHLDDKEIDEYIDFDVNSYIKNSFVYCVYWTICVGFLQPHEHFIVEQLLLKEYFSQITEIEEISKYMLNQENQWLTWASLKEQFALTDMKNNPIYNVWVSTEENMKIYTNVIKFLEKGLRIVIAGEKSSGKSILLREISNFEMSYTTFLIDCHRFTTVQQVGEVIKNRIFYTKAEKKLILIDDLSLPSQQEQVGQILKKVLDERILTCKFDHNPKVHFNKILVSEVSTLITCSQQDVLAPQPPAALDLLESNLQRINMRTYQQNDIHSVYGAYLNFQLNKMKARIAGEKGNEFQSIFRNLIYKVYKKFYLDLHSINRIVRVFLTKLPTLSTTKGQKKEDETEEKKLIQLQEIMISLNASIFTVLGFSTSFSSIEVLCYDQTSRIVGANTLKNFEDFSCKIENSRFAFLTNMLPQQKSPDLIAALLNQQKPVKEKSEMIGNYIEQIIIEKDQGIRFISTSTQVSLICRMMPLLRCTPSHIIMHSELSDPRIHSMEQNKWMEPHGFGIRSLTKIVCMFLSINFNEVENETLSTFISDTLNIIKVGGKIDEAVCYIPRNEMKKYDRLDRAPSELLSVVNSLISSTELYEFFTQDRIQQIFVKFSSEKKTLKRTEFIRKVREKINQLFHFVLSVDNDGLNYLRRNYPNLVKESSIIPVFKYPEQALYEIANKVIKPQEMISLQKSNAVDKSSEPQQPAPGAIRQELQRKAVCQSLVQIFSKLQSFLKNRYKQNGDQFKIKYKMNNIFDYFQTYETLKKKYDELNYKQDIQFSTTAWSTRRKDTQQKYEQLLSQKQKCLSENEQYFKESAIFNSKIQEQETHVARIKEHIQDSQNQKHEIIEKFNAIDLLSKNEQVKKLRESELLQSIEEKLSHYSQKQFKQLYNQKHFSDFVSLVQNRMLIDEPLKEKVIIFMEQVRELKKNEYILWAKQLHQIWNNSEQNYNDLLSLLQQWLRQWKNMFEKTQLQQDKTVEEYFLPVHKIDQKIQKQVVQVKRLEDEIEKKKNEFNKQYEQTSEKLQNFDFVCKSIAQLEPLLKIFKNFEKTLLNQDPVSQSSDEKPLALGSLVLATAYIQFGFYIGNSSDSEHFYKECKQVIRSNGLKVNDDHTFDLLLSSQQKFVNEYKVQSSNDALTVLQVGINCNLCSVIRVADDQVINLFQWIQLYTQKIVKIVETGEITQVNECLTTGGIALVVNPSLTMLKKMRPLIVGDFQLKNSNIYVNITEEIQINTTSKILLVFTEGYMSSTEIITCGQLDPLCHLLYPSISPQEKRRGQLARMLTSNPKKRAKLINEYLELDDQINYSQKKIEKIMLSMNKNNDNMDNTIMKVSSITEQKDKMKEMMDSILQQLKNLDHQKSDLDSASEQLWQKELDSIAKAVASEKIFGAFQKYISIIIQKNDYDPKILKEEAQFFLSIFAKKLEINSEQKRKDFRHHQVSLSEDQKNVRMIEQSLLKMYDHCKLQEQISQKWYRLLSTVLNLSQKSITPPTVPRAPQKILIVKTSFIEQLHNFIAHILSENQEQVVEKEIQTLNDYHVGVGGLVALVTVKSNKDWRSVTQYVNADQERSMVSKFNNQKLVVVCPLTSKIPTFIQEKCLVVELNEQIHQISYIVQKSKPPNKFKLELLEQIYLKLRQKISEKQGEVNAYQIVDEVLGQLISNHDMQQVAKYINSVFM